MPVCDDCLLVFIAFTTNQGGTMSIECEFSEEALAAAGDLDVAEHHPLCECYECLVDPDAYRKFELENDIVPYTYQEKSA